MQVIIQVAKQVKWQIDSMFEVLSNFVKRLKHLLLKLLLNYNDLCVNNNNSNQMKMPASQRSWVRIPLSHLNFSGS